MSPDPAGAGPTRAQRRAGAGVIAADFGVSVAAVWRARRLGCLERVLALAAPAPDRRKAFTAALNAMVRQLDARRRRLDLRTQVRRP